MLRASSAVTPRSGIALRGFTYLTTTNRAASGDDDLDETRRPARDGFAQRGSDVSPTRHALRAHAQTFCDVHEIDFGLGQIHPDVTVGFTHGHETVLDDPVAAIVEDHVG